MLPSPMRALGRKRQETLPDELHLAVLTGRTKKIKNLVAKGVHIESVNSLGQTPLFCASYGGDYEVVKVLLRLGANPNRRCGSRGAAPVHAASYRGSRRVLRYLVEAGGDLSLRDAEQQTPRDYALKQQAPIRRQKILEFFDLLYGMTLHRMAAASTTLPHSSSTLPSSTGTLLSTGDTGSLAGTLKGHRLRKGLFGGSQLSLSRRSAHQSTTSVWSSCVSDVSSSSTSNPPVSVSQDEVDNSKTKEIVLTPNLHKSVSCHLLDQLCVTTSLPLLSPAQLQRPQTPSPAYTCGGPTVYSSFSWLGTPVTVRRPTPALAFSNYGKILNEGADGDSPDQDAVRSLLHELSFLRRLRHPGFLEVMAACHVTHPSPDHVTLVYQHVLHGSLYHHLHVQHHDLSVGGAVDILIGLVEALLFMHAHGWYHCGLSSHALHLVSLGSAKLGGFEYAFESQVKGVGMRAEHISKCGWLTPWQAPETILQKMVSVRTEVYSVSTIIWEIWSGMAPWAGVEEGEISKRIENGEVLPPLKGTSLSLVSYLTEYGLKWNSHERELDLQEIHTMLRSLRIQCNEDERVPAVTSWGPPSIPNTPVIGRQSASKPLDSSLSSSSSGELRLDNGIFWPLGYQNGTRVSFEGSQGRILGEKTPMRQVAKVKGRDNKCVMMKSNFEKAQECVKKHFAHLDSVENNEDKQTHESCKENGKEKLNQLIKNEGSRDSGFSTPCSRTPSPTYDNLATSKSPSILTSTPVRSTTCCKTDGQKPDLLPNKVTPKAFMSSTKSENSPDLLSHDSKFMKGSNSESEDNFSFVRNAAKRAFLQSGGDIESDSVSSAASSPVSERERKNRKNFPMEVVKRGLSLSNICGSALTCPSATVFTRTTSHISLSSSSGDICRKKPQRTISQVTLTMRKLSLSSSSASSVNSSDSLAKKGKDDKGQDGEISKTDSSLSKGNKSSITTKALCESRVITDRREVKRKEYSNEIVGIKPASHQLTRHSSSCSLASGPPSPAHNASLSVFNSSRNSRLANSHDCLSTSPKSEMKHQTLPLSPRPLSLFADKGSLLTEATGATNAKLQSRRHSESYKKNKRTRRKHDLELEEEFIDDEFDANLYDQPHMQLSVGSSENLLENRLSFSLVHDSASSSSLSPSQTSRQVTSSEDDDDDLGKRVRGGTNACRKPSMKALQETEDSDDGTDSKSSTEQKVSRSKEDKKSKENEKDSSKTDNNNKASSSISESESEDAFWKKFSRGSADDSLEDFERLKSAKATRTLEKNFSNYLPTYSFVSDTDDSGEA